MYRGADEYKTKWVGHGNESMCTDPKLLWESIVVKLEDMVSFVEFQYYHDNKEKYTHEQMQDIVSTLETSKGRCFSLTPNSEMIKKGIRHVHFELVSLSKIYISHSGTFEYTADKIKGIKNLMGNTGYYEVDYELFDMLDDKSTTCNNDPKYGKDKCAQEELEKYLIKDFGCTPPFFENKEKICTNETISKQVWKYWNSKKYNTKCPDPCRAIEMIKAIEMENKITKNIMSGLKLYFHHRGKVVKSYYAYSGLSLIAEIGGYFGLFLGVSINQITYVTSFLQERVQNYPFWIPIFKFLSTHLYQ